jgi:hypothetical protein
MALCRLLLAVLIGLAVATAPVGAAMASVKSTAKSEMTDCHGKGVKLCPDCDGDAKKMKCPGDGSKCCKLTGTMAALSEMFSLAIAAQKIDEPQAMSDRPLRPRTPPPRS